MRLGCHRLIESLLWTPTEGFWLLDLHLQRLLRSARFFELCLVRESLRQRLELTASQLTEAAKVRLLIDCSGAAHVEAVPLTAGAGAIREPLRVAIAPSPVDSNDPWLFHKTSNRSLYEAARRARPSVDDVLLCNERGELTEASSSNVVVVLAGRKWTPPMSAGLLPGTFRRSLIDRGEVKERSFRVEELAAADEILLINSVRKWRRARLVL